MIRRRIRAIAYCRQKIYLHETCSCVSGRIGDAEVPSRLARPVRTMSATVWPFWALFRPPVQILPAALSLAEVEALSGRGRRHVLDVAGGLAC